MPDPVTLNFVSNDVLGGEWLQWAEGFTSVTDLVDQAIERADGAPIERLVIAQHGAVGTHGFVCLDVNQSEIIDGSSGTFNETITSQLGRLKGHWADEAIIEMRVCEFGTELNGSKAMQMLADAAGVPVTAPTDEIKSLGLVGGLTTNWKTVYPSSWDRPMEVSFWRGDPESAPAVPLRPEDIAGDGPDTKSPALTETQPASAPEPPSPTSSSGGSGLGSLFKSRGFQAASAGIAIALIVGVCALGPDDADPTAVDTPVASDSASGEPATDDSAPSTDEPADNVSDDPNAALGSDLFLVPELPLQVRAEYNWEPTRCDVLPESGEMDVQPRPGTLGASIDVGLGIRGLLGGANLEFAGGGGGTIEQDGVVTKESTVAELISLEHDGFTALIERLEGEANEDGEFVDPDTATCLEGGRLTFRLDESHWSQWVSMPRLDESLLEVGKEPTCLAEPDGDSIRVFFGTSLAGPAVAPKIGSGIAEVRYFNWFNVPLVVTDASMDSPQSFQLSSEGETVTAPEDLVEMYRNGGIVGGLRFTPEQGVDTAEPVDFALQFRYGIFSAFTWSVICDWTG